MVALHRMHKAHAHAQQAAGSPVFRTFAELLPKAAAMTASRFLSASGILRSAMSAGNERSFAGQLDSLYQPDGPVMSTCPIKPLGNRQQEQHKTNSHGLGVQQPPALTAQQSPGPDQTSISDGQQTTSTFKAASLAEQGVPKCLKAWVSRDMRLYDISMASCMSGQQSRRQGTLARPGSQRSTIAVGISGGVDSAVAAMLLKEQG